MEFSKTYQIASYTRIINTEQCLCKSCMLFKYGRHHQLRKRIFFCETPEFRPKKKEKKKLWNSIE